MLIHYSTEKKWTIFLFKSTDIASIMLKKQARHKKRPLSLMPNPSANSKSFWPCLIYVFYTWSIIFEPLLKTRFYFHKKMTFDHGKKITKFKTNWIWSKKNLSKEMDWALVSLVVAWNLERAIFLPNWILCVTRLWKEMHFNS